MWRIIVPFLVLSHSGWALPKASSATSSGNRNLVWAGGGTGNATFYQPHGLIDSSNYGYWSAGVEVATWDWPFAFTLGAELQQNVGLMYYDYSGPDGVRYQANLMKYGLVSVDFRLGFKIRFLDLDQFHFYGEFGGNLGTAVFVNSNTDYLGSQGSNYKKSQDSINANGYYAEGGFDVFYGEVGGRLAFKYSVHNYTQLETLANAYPRSEEVSGYAAVLRSF